MKKFYLFLIAFVFSLGSIFAQKIEGLANKSSLPVEANLVNGRGNAPQETLDIQWDYVASKYGSYFNELAYDIVYVDNYSYIVVKYQWDKNGTASSPKTSYPKIVLSFSVPITAEEQFGEWNNPYDGEDYFMLPKGTYAFSSSYRGWYISASNATSWPSGFNKSLLYLPSGTKTNPYTGWLEVQEGADGPYMTTLNNWTIMYQGQEYGYYNITIGSPAEYCDVDVVSENDAKGSTIFTYKSGYVYPNYRESEFKKGSVYTLTATPNLGYHFVSWKKGNDQISTNETVDVTIDGDAVYTAFFEADENTVFIPVTIDSYNDNTNTIVNQEWRNWEFSAIGIGSDNQSYSVIVKYIADSPVGLFDYSKADKERVALYQGSAPIELSSVSTTVVEEDERYLFTSTFIGANGKTYIVETSYPSCTHREFQTPSNTSFKFNTPSDHITMEIFTDPEDYVEPGWGMWYFRDTKEKQFIRISAYNNSGSYFQCFLWAGNYIDTYTQTYSKGVGPKAGIYSHSVDPRAYISENDVDGLIVHWLFYRDLIDSKECVFFNEIAFEYEGRWTAYERIKLDCMYSTFFASRASDGSLTNIQSLEGCIVKVVEGKDGNPYITVEKNESVIFSIGEPIDDSGYKVDTYHNGRGKITKNPDDCFYQEGTQVILTPIPEDNWVFDSWTGECADLIDNNGDGTYTFTVPAYDCAVIANFVENSGNTLTWDFKGGVTTSAESDYTHGTNIPEDDFIKAPADPTLDGYTFSGWLNSITGKIEFSDFGFMPATMPAEDLTYTAQWTANTYTVHFDNNNDYYQANGAITGEMEDQPFTYDAADVALAANAFVWEGHTFQGWTTAAGDNVEYADQEEVRNLTTENGDIVTLYAVWETNNYTITFQDAEADGGSVWWSDDFAYGTVPAYNGEPMPSKEADEQYTYQFAGWKDAAGIEYPIGRDLPAVEGETTYYAVYTATKVPYELVWDVNGGDELTGDYTQGTVEWETDIIAPATPTRMGYTFTGWMNGNTNEIETPAEETNVMPTAMPTGGLTYTAQWTANTYTVHFENNNDYYQANGAITGEMEDQLFTYDAADVALTANAYEWAGHTFQGWATAADGEKVYEDGEAVSNLTAEQNGEVVLYAVWDINEYTITFQDAEADGGHVWGSDDFAYGTVPAYNGETMPSKEADEQYEYQFAGWKDAAGIEYPIGRDLPEVTEDATYYAVYTPTKVPYELVWEANGGDELTGDYTQGMVEWGTEIVAPATPTREGYTFTGWMNGNTNEIETPAEETNVMHTAMPAEGLTYMAQWEANAYYVRFYDNGEYYEANGAIEGTMPDQTFYYDEGQYLQANAFTWEGHTFQGWATTADGEVVYGDVEDITENLTSVKDAVIELYAVWKTDTYTITFKNAMGDDDHVWWSGELAYGTIPVYEGETPVKAADADYTYTFAGWMVNLEEQYPIGTDLPKVTEDATYLAMYTQKKTEFTVRFVNPDGSELQSYELPLGAVPVFEGEPIRENEYDELDNYYVFTFTHWTDQADNEYKSNTMPAVTGDATYTAQYDKELNIILQEQKDDTYYTKFSENYNGETAATATLNRQFSQGKWATICVPFTVSKAQLSAVGIQGRVYEFKYTKGDAATGITLYFAQASKLEPGKGYIVNANAALSKKTKFVFYDVLVNTQADIQSGFDITALAGVNSQGNIYLVGTLRQGTVYADQGNGNYYLGLNNNKIFSANPTIGTVVRAYRGIFRSTEPISVPRIRVVAESEEGEIVEELEVVNGDLVEAMDTKKYVQDGILYIVRDGIRYSAQGQRLD